MGGVFLSTALNGWCSACYRCIALFGIGLLDLQNSDPATWEMNVFFAVDGCANQVLNYGRQLLKRCLRNLSGQSSTRDWSQEVYSWGHTRESKLCSKLFAFQPRIAARKAAKTNKQWCWYALFAWHLCLLRRVTSWNWRRCGLFSRWMQTNNKVNW